MKTLQMSLKIGRVTIPLGLASQSGIVSVNDCIGQYIIPECIEITLSDSQREAIRRAIRRSRNQKNQE